MKTNTIITICATIILITVFGTLSLFNAQKETNIPQFLTYIFPTSRIQVKEGVNHYLIGSTEYFAKETNIGSTTLSVVVENDQKNGATYRFYSSGPQPKLLKEVGSFIPLEDSNQAFNQVFYYEKDITGDGVSELFVLVERSASNLEYEILRLDGGTLVNITVQNQKDNPTWVDLDDAWYKNGYVYMSWHAVDATGETKYQLQGNTLVPLKNVGFFDIEYSDNCEVRVSEMGGNLVVVDHKSCSTLETNFDPYF